MSKKQRILLIVLTAITLVVIFFGGNIGTVLYLGLLVGVYTAFKQPVKRFWNALKH